MSALRLFNCHNRPGEAGLRFVFLDFSLNVNYLIYLWLYVRQNKGGSNTMRHIMLFGKFS